jgi:hypothetical protein
VLGVLAAAVLFAGQWDLDATAMTESRAGETIILDPAANQMNPTPAVNPSSRGFVAQIVRPIADVSFKSADSTFRLEYGPRILWQTPHPAGDSALILHIASLSVAARTDKTVSFTAAATGSIGKPDYSALLLTTSTTPPNVTDIATASAQAGATVRFSETVSGLVGLRFSLFKVLNDLDMSSMPTAPLTLVTSQTIVGFDPGVRVRLSPRDTLAFESSVTGAWYSNGLTYLTLTPNAIWTTRFDPYTTFRVQAGLSHARPITQPKPTSTDAAERESVTAPIGLVGIDSVLSRREGVVFRVSGDGGGNVVFDPILGRADPRVVVRASASLTVVPEWMFAVRGDFSTSVDPPPSAIFTDASGKKAAIAPIVTTYSVTASARRLVSSNVVVELGAFFADRGPPLNTTDFAFVQPSRWVYLMLTASTRGMGRFAQ